MLQRVLWNFLFLSIFFAIHHKNVFLCHFFEFYLFYLLYLFYLFYLHKIKKLYTVQSPWNNVTNYILSLSLTWPNNDLCKYHVDFHNSFILSICHSCCVCMYKSIFRCHQSFILSFTLYATYMCNLELKIFNVIYIICHSYYVCVQSDLKIFNVIYTICHFTTYVCSLETVYVCMLSGLKIISVIKVYIVYVFHE